MNLLELVTDPYERKARVQPALLLLFFPVLTASLMLFVTWGTLSTVILVLVSCGGTAALAHFARSRGKALEAKLFAATPFPSISMLRHRDSRIDSISKERYHATLGKLVPGALPPSIEDEHSDPLAADAVYSAWSTFLRTHTRDRTKFRLLFIENTNYGFLRNGTGLRPYAVAANVAAAVLGGIWLCRQYEATDEWNWLVIATAACALCLALAWSAVFRKSSVLLAADAYGARLLEASDQVDS